MSGYVESLMGENEKVLVHERQHWIIWIPPLLLAILITAIIAAASLFAGAMTNGVGYFGLIFLIFPVWYFVRIFLDWVNETYIVTNRRIIQTEGVINKSVMDSSLEKINDVLLQQSIMGRMLDYGDLEILTSSDYGVNKLHRIQSPVKFKIAMLNAKEGTRDSNDIGAAAQGERPAKKNDIPELISDLDELRKKGLITEEEFQEKRNKLMNQI